MSNQIQHFRQELLVASILVVLRELHLDAASRSLLGKKAFTLNFSLRRCYLNLNYSIGPYQRLSRQLSTPSEFSRRYAPAPDRFI